MEQVLYSKLLGTMGARISTHPVRLSIDKSRGTSGRTHSNTAYCTIAAGGKFSLQTMLQVWPNQLLLP